MTKFIRQSLTAYAKPLCETVAEMPEPVGSEVVVRIRRCGVCHSDVHLQDGYFVLGPDKNLDVTAGRNLPFTLGHEIAGVVERVGPQAQGASVGQEAAVFPWIGCGTCAACAAGEENMCAAPRHLGVYVDGGFATHLMVPHPRYLLDYAPLPAALAAAYMCSGLTAYAALKRLARHAARGPTLLVGLGGVGMMGLALARAMFAFPPLVAEIDPAKREAALKAILAATGGVFAACDFVGSDRSLQFALGALAKGGKVVVTGLIGGMYSTPIAMFPLRAMTIEGTLVGTLEDAREMLALARAGKVPPVPITERPLQEAQATLDDLRNGRIIGRVVLAT
jgi:alcohol dehydrogenase, propanol-preferring